MAKVSYVPYSEVYADLFKFCGITLTTSDFGGNQGWDAAAFATAAIDAKEYLDEHWNDDQDETLENWYNMLDGYEVFFWSTEGPGYY